MKGRYGDHPPHTIHPKPTDVAALKGEEGEEDDMVDRHRRHRNNNERNSGHKSNNNENSRKQQRHDGGQDDDHKEGNTAHKKHHGGEGHKLRGHRGVQAPKQRRDDSPQPHSPAPAPQHHRHHAKSTINVEERVLSFLQDIESREGGDGNGRPPPADAANSLDSTKQAAAVAYAVVISNEDFIDGALVMGQSFLQQSALVQHGIATLVAIIPAGAICDESMERLQLAGWSHLYVVQDLTQEAARSHYAATLNKLYLFNLTQYRRVATFDVDMLMLRSPDSVFLTKLPNASWVGALGNSHHKKTAYFQTGMMVMVPQVATFEWMMHRFRTDPHEHGPNARDGSIVRAFYQDRYVIIDGDLSAHLGIHEPLNYVIGFHYRGEFKPWFNREIPPTASAYGDKSGKPMETELGEAYRLWWAAYEKLHEMQLTAMDVRRYNIGNASETTVDNGDDNSGRGSSLLLPPPEYDPNIHAWVMRHTTRSYIQLTDREETRRRNLTYDGLFVEAGAVGTMNCHEVCAQHGSVCKDDALRFLLFDRCETMEAMFDGCRGGCTLEDASHDAPAYDTAQRRCFVNSLHYQRLRPTCDAVPLTPDRQRMCACLSAVLDNGDPPLNIAPVHNDDSPQTSDDRLSRLRVQPFQLATQLPQSRNLPFEPEFAHSSSSTAAAGGGLSEQTKRKRSDCRPSQVAAFGGPEGWQRWMSQEDERDGGEGMEDVTREGEARCLSYLADWSNVRRVTLLGRSPWVGRTIKFLLHYHEEGIYGVLKLPQRHFPQEARNEVAAFAVDRLLGLDRIPPTSWVYVPLHELEKTLEEQDAALRESVAVQQASAVPAFNGTFLFPQRATTQQQQSPLPPPHQVLQGTSRSLFQSLVSEFVRGGAGKGIGVLEEEEPSEDGSSSHRKVWVPGSVQLWVHDVHRLPNSMLADVVKKHPAAATASSAVAATNRNAFSLSLLRAVQRDVEREAATHYASNTATGANNHSLLLHKDEDVHRVLRELSRLTIFDFIVKNDDRTIAKNMFVAGGCTAFCAVPPTAPHIAAVYRQQYKGEVESAASLHLVALDQGHSFSPLILPETTTPKSEIEDHTALRDGDEGDIVPLLTEHPELTKYWVEDNLLSRAILSEQQGNARATKNGNQQPTFYCQFAKSWMESLARHSLAAHRPHEEEDDVPLQKGGGPTAPSIRNGWGGVVKAAQDDASPDAALEKQIPRWLSKLADLATRGESLRAAVAAVDRARKSLATSSSFTLTEGELSDVQDRLEAMMNHVTRCVNDFPAEFVLG